MTIENEDNTTPETPDGDKAAPEVDTPEPSLEEAALAAMDEGIAEVSDPKPGGEGEAEEPETEPEATNKAESESEGEQEDKAAGKDADTKKGEGKEEEGDKPDTEVEEEIKALNLKDKTAERFRELAPRYKETTPVIEAMEKVGIKNCAELAENLPRLVQQSKDYGDLIGMVQDTGANPEQYGGALDYLRDANAAIAGDAKAAQRAYEKTMAEAALWAKMLGKDLPGVDDPLSEHPDLAREVDSGDLTRERALEIAGQRNTSKLQQAHMQTVTQTQQQEQQSQQAMAQGTADLDALGKQLAATDPDFERKQPFLLPTLRVITRTLPPNQWAKAAQDAYAQIPAMPAAAPAPAPAARKPPPGPVRPGGPRPPLQPTTDDPMEALEMGINAANGM